MKRITSALTCGALMVPAVLVGADLIEAVRPAGSVLELQVAGVAGVPADASAVVLNLTSADARGTGFLTAWPCGTARPNASNLNYGTGAPVANSAIVKVGAGGKVCLFTADSDTELIADINGWFAAGSSYASTTPSRLLDTRPGLSTVDGKGAGEGRRTAGTIYELPVTGRAGVPANAAAVVLNLTSAEAGGTGFVTAYPCGSALPVASNLNYRVGAPVANSAIVKVGTNGKVCLLVADADTQLIADVNGYFPATGYTSMTPARLLDTRSPQSTVDGSAAGEGLRRAGMTYELPVWGRAGVPANTPAVVLNLTSAGAVGTGFLTAYPCGTTRPVASNLNYGAGAPVANSAIVKVGTNGKVCLFTGDTDTQLIADVNGYFPATAGASAAAAAAIGYTPMTPARLLDTRSPTAAPVPVPVPGGAVFVETFDNNTGLDRFNHGVWHRDEYLVGETQWTGDHDLNCGTPATQRVIQRSQPDESFYTCVNHVMTAVGDTSGYSIAWLSPNQTFASVRAVQFDVNLTDLNDRKWWKVGVVSEARYNSTYRSCCKDAPGFLASDVGAADLPTSLATSDLFAATWSGGASAGYPGGMKIGNSGTSAHSNPTPNDKATRHPVSMVDNRNGTVTFTVAGVSATAPGAFPACPCRVVLYDHNYTPDKDGVPQGHTWHWDNIIVIG